MIEPSAEARERAGQIVSLYHSTTPLGTSRDYSVLVDAIACALAEKDAALAEAERVLRASLSDEPGDGGYIYLVECSGSRREPAGQRGGSCCCHPRLRGGTYADESTDGDDRTHDKYADAELLKRIATLEVPCATPPCREAPADDGTVVPCAAHSVSRRTAPVATQTAEAMPAAWRATAREALAELERIASDVGEVERLPEIQTGERRAWRSVEAQLRALLARPEVQEMRR